MFNKLASLPHSDNFHVADSLNGSIHAGGTKLIGQRTLSSHSTDCPP